MELEREAASLALATGMVADTTGSLTASLLLPAICYAVIATVGWYARKPA